MIIIRLRKFHWCFILVLSSCFLRTSQAYTFQETSGRSSLLRIAAFAERNTESDARSAMITIDEYMKELWHDDSLAREELRVLYRDEWNLRKERLITALLRYRRLFPHVKEVVIARAPGRITANEHTDYNDAVSLGIPTIQDDIAIVGIDTTSERIELVNMESDRFPACEPFAVSELADIKIQPREKKSDVPWTDFSIALLQSLVPVLQSYGIEAIPGMCILIDGREAYGGVPVESNISSSAAFEEAQIYAIEAALGRMGRMTAGEVIEIGRASERKIGFPSGKLDQGTSTGGRLAVEPGQIIGAAIDCVPRLDESGRDKTIIESFEIPDSLEAVLVNTGPKEDAQREYNIRVIEGELGAWIVARRLQEDSDWWRQLNSSQQTRQLVRKLYGDINPDHNGRPYLYNQEGIYPVFFKPVFFTYRRLAEIGYDGKWAPLRRRLTDILPEEVTKQELVDEYGDEFLDFYVASALPFHYILARAKLDKTRRGRRVDEETLKRWVEAWLRGELESIRPEMKRYWLSPRLFRGLEVSSYNLQGTVFHAIGEEDRAPEIMQALQDAATATNEAERNDALERFGSLQRAGYESLRHNYRNSSSNIDSLVAWAGSQPWCLTEGACRHFGAGWGGWMEIWIKPGMYDTAEAAIKAFLTEQDWYKKVAAEKKMDMPQALDQDIMPFKPGMPASILGRGNLISQLQAAGYRPGALLPETTVPRPLGFTAPTAQILSSI